jgi:hypothetical protein
VSAIYLGSNVTAMLSDGGELTLRKNHKQDVTDTIVLKHYEWTYLLHWIEQMRKEDNANAHRLLGPYSVL